MENEDVIWVYLVQRNITKLYMQADISTISNNPCLHNPWSKTMGSVFTHDTGDKAMLFKMQWI